MDPSDHERASLPGLTADAADLDASVPQVGANDVEGAHPPDAASGGSRSAKERRLRRADAALGRLLRQRALS